MAKQYLITEKEYQEKKFEIAKNLLPTMVGQQTEAYVQDPRKREALMYNCVAYSDHLMRELGYKIGVSAAGGAIATPQDDPTKVGDRTAIRKLSEMLKDE